ncbi:hypothetical protein [Neorhizobium sp. JUb45]|uniref:hypothetical protein n=1 Tax=Neorhizobium sp. JUb45 TaxID=2485113 RepID=UPI0010534B33|nr:hypothetical protein [Neorhizobium sp. JUb45]TCQ97187.1 hypothetical protein EDF70_11477 [Neorhizobium sp. JUb45]
MTDRMTVAQRNHIALHLAHRWFAFLEAPGGSLESHLKMFHPLVRLSGHRGTHLFATDHNSLIAWFKAIPDEVSSHHIVHSSYSDDNNGEGLLSMVVAYQAPSTSGIHGSIIAYETRIEFAPEGPRFIAVDKTPILPNTKSEYETSWATNRVLSRVHADLAGLEGAGADRRLISTLGSDMQKVSALTSAPEGSSAYEAIVTAMSDSTQSSRVVRLTIRDCVGDVFPTIEVIESALPPFSRIEVEIGDEIFS